MSWYPDMLAALPRMSCEVAIANSEAFFSWRLDDSFGNRGQTLVNIFELNTCVGILNSSALKSVSLGYHSTVSVLTSIESYLEQFGFLTW